MSDFTGKKSALFTDPDTRFYRENIVPKYSDKPGALNFFKGYHSSPELCALIDRTIGGKLEDLQEVNRRLVELENAPELNHHDRHVVRKLRYAVKRRMDEMVAFAILKEQRPGMSDREINEYIREMRRSRSFKKWLSENRRK